MARHATGKRSIYYDCDTGIDDSMGLAFLLASPEVELAGIGTVSGNTEAAQAAENTLGLLGLAARTDIPVAIGAAHFLTHEYPGAPTEIHGDNGIGNVDLPIVKVTPVNESAAEMLVRLAKDHDGELEIITVGPMTNLALWPSPQIVDR